VKKKVDNLHCTALMILDHLKYCLHQILFTWQNCK